MRNFAADLSCEGLTFAGAVVEPFQMRNLVAASCWYTQSSKHDWPRRPTALPSPRSAAAEAKIVLAAAAAVGDVCARRRLSIQVRRPSRKYSLCC
jgi:hypothetical protein